MAEEKAIEAAARAVAEHKGYNPDEKWEEWTRQVDADGNLISYPRIRWRVFEAEAQAAITAYLAQREADGFVEANKAALSSLAQQISALAYENGTLKAIVQGWHYLAVGPDEMGDYYTHKQLVKASEPYASPALKTIAARPKGDAG